MSKHVSEEPVAVRQLAPAASEGISALIEKMMAKRPEDRHQTPEELLSDITLVEAGGVPSVRKGRMLKRSGAKAPVHPVAVGPLAGMRRIPIGAVIRKATGMRTERAQWIAIAIALAVLLAVAVLTTLWRFSRRASITDECAGGKIAARHAREAREFASGGGKMSPDIRQWNA
jgi:serine/threonine-protein kinase